MNQLQKALVDAGLAERPVNRFKRKRKARKVLCDICGHQMDLKDGTNVYVCNACGHSYKV